MAKKIKCCQKSLATPISCNSSSSSSSCSSLKSSSTQNSCCKQYPKCKCPSYKNNCVPIYYTNNYINQYACPQKCIPPPFCPPQCPPKCIPPPFCPPQCPPYFPPSSPCNPPQCNPIYNTNPIIITGNGTTINMVLNPTYNIFIINPLTDSSGNINLPDICTSLCNSNKMFIISNISSLNTIKITPNLTDLINGLDSTNMFVIPINTSITLYSSCIAGKGYWTVIGL